jgi:hypothetical protein
MIQWVTSQLQNFLRGKVREIADRPPWRRARIGAEAADEEVTGGFDAGVEVEPFEHAREGRDFRPRVRGSRFEQVDRNPEPVPQFGRVVEREDVRKPQLPAFDDPREAGVVRVVIENRRRLLGFDGVDEGLQYFRMGSRWTRACAEGKPNFDAPCGARRRRIEKREGLFLHFCIDCGAWGAYGHGVNLRAGRLGHWYCAVHRPRAGHV